MKKMFKSFTFYFLIASVIIIITHIRGGDSHGIVLFHLNPILKPILSTDFADTLNSGFKVANGSIQGATSVYWYIAHFISFALMGAALDLIKNLVKRSSKRKSAS
ncbi:hypothetical protein [Anaerolentibacter hominis]|uniref:hypothetical protein n=1 Tax=Anaerolentibacter hominis TaxID=3079009 RepID=UPI0031B858EA